MLFSQSRESALSQVRLDAARPTQHIDGIGVGINAVHTLQTLQAGSQICANFRFAAANLPFSVRSPIPTLSP